MPINKSQKQKRDELIQQRAEQYGIKSETVIHLMKNHWNWKTFVAGYERMKNAPVKPALTPEQRFNPFDAIHN